MDKKRFKKYVAAALLIFAALFLPSDLLGSEEDPYRGWSLFARVHHRSGVFGLVREKQGSNIIGGGLRGSF